MRSNCSLILLHKPVLSNWRNKIKFVLIDIYFHDTLADHYVSLIQFSSLATFAVQFTVLFVCLLSCLSFLFQVLREKNCQRWKRILTNRPKMCISSSKELLAMKFSIGISFFTLWCNKSPKRIIKMWSCQNEAFFN